MSETSTVDASATEGCARPMGSETATPWWAYCSASTSGHQNDLIQSSRVTSTEAHESSAVYICRRCGEFRVHTMSNGETAVVTFRLSNPDHVRYAGIWSAELDAGENKKP